MQKKEDIFPNEQVKRSCKWRPIVGERRFILKGKNLLAQFRGTEFFYWHAKHSSYSLSPLVITGDSLISS